MSDGNPEVKLAVLQEWKGHVDRRVDQLERLMATTRQEQRESNDKLASEVRAGLREVRDDIGVISRHVGQPLLSWPQVLTIAVAMLGALAGLAAIAA